jgi:cold shock protein
MATGKVLQFDAIRGYGFVTADDGGEDIFLHASAFDGDPGDLIPGLELEFQVMAGDRGRKAYAAHFPNGNSSPPPRVVIATAAPSPSLTLDRTISADDDEEMCDAVPEPELIAEITELLLNTIPALTGPQIKEVRVGVVELAKQHGWVDIPRIPVET